jgi:hypothetical protein
VSVAIKRDAIRGERQQKLHAFSEPLKRLFGQSKQDVGVQAFDLKADESVIEA